MPENVKTRGKQVRRILEVLRLVEENPRATVNDLLREFDSKRSSRTLRRDLQILEDACLVKRVQVRRFHKVTYQALARLEWV